ncbi:MAG: hypothetical protein AAF790_07565 [Planctomycetota bacterium]
MKPRTPREVDAGAGSGAGRGAGRGAGGGADADGWAPCQAGTLAGAAAQLNRRDRLAQRAAAVKTAGVVGVAAAAVVVAGGLVGGPLGGRPAVAPMQCGECMANFAGYAEHLAGPNPEEGPAADPLPGAGRRPAVLDQATIARVEQHLRSCEMCRGKFQAQHPGLLAAASRAIHAAATAMYAALFGEEQPRQAA